MSSFGISYEKVLVITRAFLRTALPGINNVHTVRLISNPKYSLVHYTNIPDIALGIGLEVGINSLQMECLALWGLSESKSSDSHLTFSETSINGALYACSYFLIYPLQLCYNSYLSRKMMGEKVYITTAIKDIALFAKDKQNYGSGGGITSLWTGCITGTISRFLDHMFSYYLTTLEINGLRRLSITFFSFIICDVILRNITLQMQISNMSKVSVESPKNRSKSLLSCVYNMYKEEGITAFVRGWIKQALFNGLSFTTNSMGIGEPATLFVNNELEVEDEYHHFDLDSKPLSLRPSIEIGDLNE